MRKRIGTFQLSMNFIIIAIFGVALLALLIIWLSTMFRSLPFS